MLSGSFKSNISLLLDSVDIDMKDVFVPDSHRLANAKDFNSTNIILAKSRITVFYFAAGVAAGAYEAALKYTLKRKQFGK